MGQTLNQAQWSVFFCILTGCQGFADICLSSLRCRVLQRRVIRRLSARARSEGNSMRRLLLFMSGFDTGLCFAKDKVLSSTLPSKPALHLREVYENAVMPSWFTHRVSRYAFFVRQQSTCDLYAVTEFVSDSGIAQLLKINRSRLSPIVLLSTHYPSNKPQA